MGHHTIDHRLTRPRGRPGAGQVPVASRHHVRRAGLTLCQALGHDRRRAPAWPAASGAEVDRQAPGLLRPVDDIGAFPHTADGEVGDGGGELRVAGELVDALAAKAEQLGDLDGAHKVHKMSVGACLYLPSYVLYCSDPLLIRMGQETRWPRRCWNTPGPGHDGGSRHDGSGPYAPWRGGCPVSGRGAAGKRTWRLARWGVALVAPAGLVVVIGLGRTVLLAAGAGMVWFLVRLPRLERRVFGSNGRAVLVRPEVIAREVPRPAGESGLGVEGHRAFARALHAVTAAYLADCEREAQR
jgi:hypothetical protein